MDGDKDIPHQTIPLKIDMNMLIEEAEKLQQTSKEIGGRSY